MSATITRCTRDEVFLGPVHSYVVDLGENARGTQTETTYSRSVAGWTRTTQKIGPSTDWLWRETESVRTAIGRVVDAVANDRATLEDVAKTELYFTSGQTRGRKALIDALGRHGLGVAA